MVDSSLIAVGGTLGGALISAIAVLHKTNKQEKIRSERTRGEKYLELKVECLHELNEKIVELDATLGAVPYWDGYKWTGSIEELASIFSTLDEYHKAVSRSELYLEEDQIEPPWLLHRTYQTILYKCVEETVGSMEEMQNLPEIPHPVEDIDGQKYKKILKMARETIRNEIDDPIESLNV